MPIETMTLIAPRGRTCPMEMSREVIDDQTPVVVANCNYYRARVAEGSLIEVKRKATKK